LIDTHCHLDAEASDTDRVDVVDAARAVGVLASVVPGIHADGWHRLLDLCKSAPFLYPALGLHPAFLDRHREMHVEALERLIAKSRPTAVGEIGLDFLLRDLDRNRQQVSSVVGARVTR